MIVSGGDGKARGGGEKKEEGGWIQFHFRFVVGLYCAFAFDVWLGFCLT